MFTKTLQISKPYIPGDKLCYDYTHSKSKPYIPGDNEINNGIHIETNTWFVGRFCNNISWYCAYKGKSPLCFVCDNIYRNGDDERYLIAIVPGKHSKMTNLQELLWNEKNAQWSTFRTRIIQLWRVLGKRKKNLNHNKMQISTDHVPNSLGGLYEKLRLLAIIAIEKYSVIGYKELKNTLVGILVKVIPRH